MNNQDTKDLYDILEKIHLSEYDKFCIDNRERMNGYDAFGVYMKGLLKERGMTQQSVFLKADIPERYGYKLLSGEKRTKQRDVILRICYGAQMSLSETQRALRKYEMPQLYPKSPRDALIMIMFNERPGSIIEFNEVLKKKGMEPLRTSGVQE